MPISSRTVLQGLPRWLLFVAVFSPAIFTAHLVWTKAVDVGTWDMWENAPLMEKWRSGALTWQDLYAPQIQHRIVVPRLLIIALTELSGGDFRWEQYAGYVLIAIVAALVWLLLKRTLGHSAWRWPLMFAFNLLLFCPMHYQQFLWGAAIWSLFPMPCMLGAILLLTPQEEERRSWGRLIVAVFLAEVGTHSFGHGLAIWPVLLGLVLVNARLGNLRHRVALATMGSIVAAVTIAFYFTNFINVAWHAYGLNPGDHALSGGTSLLDPGNLREAVRFFFGFFGAWFARTPFLDRPIEAAVVLGKITLALFTAVAIFAVRNRLWRATLPWLAVAGYVLLVGLMVSKRGADIGEHRAVTPRYLAASQHLLIAGIAMTATLGLVFRRANERWSANHPDNDAGQSRRVAHTCGVVLLTIFCTAQVPVWQYGLHLTDVWHHARRQSQALLLFLPHLQDQGRLISMETLDKESSSWHCLDAVNTLDRLGLLRTRPLETPELKWFATDKPLPTNKADVTSANLLDDGILELRGVGRFNVGNPIDAVLVVQNGRVVSLGQPTPQNLLRIYALDYEFSNTDEVHAEEMYPWQARVRLPASGEEAPVELWALDVAQRRISRVPITLSIDRAAKTVKVTRQD